MCGRILGRVAFTRVRPREWQAFSLTDVKPEDAAIAPELCKTRAEGAVTLIHYQSTLELKTTVIDDEAAGELFVREVGHSLPEAGVSLRLPRRDVWTIHFVVSGACDFCGITVRAGEGCIVPPGIPFEILTGERLEHYWIMAGGGAARILGGIEAPRLFSCGFFENIRGDFDRIILSGAAGGFDAPLFMTSLFYKSAAFMNAPGSFSSDRQSGYVSAAKAFIDSRYGSQIGVEDIAAAAHVSSRYLCKLFVKRLGKSPLEALTDRRMECARYLLLSSALTVAEVAREVGYMDPGRFGIVFRSRHGVSPGRFRADHAEF